MRMMMKVLSLVTLLFVFAACNGMKSASNDDSSVKKNEDPDPTPPTPPTWEGVELKAAIAQGEHQNTIAVDVDKDSQSLILILPLAMSPNVVLVSGTVPNYPDIRFDTVQKNDKWYLAFYIPLKYLVNHLISVPPTKLPNGQDLPGVPGGELPVIAFKISQMQDFPISLYLAKSVAAVYVESTWLNLPVYLRYPIRNKTTNQTVGYFALVPPKDSYNGGFYLSTIIPDNVARYLDQLFPN